MQQVGSESNAKRRRSNQAATKASVGGELGNPQLLHILPSQPQVQQNKLIKDRLIVPHTRDELRAAMLVANNRPPALREYDQISMRSVDLLRQVKLLAPYLANKAVTFVGDNDSTALLLGMLHLLGHPCPDRMVILDFDERILDAAYQMAHAWGFAGLLEVRRYNVFDPIPADLRAQFDWFYTNPPYGSHNAGASTRLFITRGCETLRSTEVSGCIIIPDDAERAWTREAMWETQHFLCSAGWIIGEKIDQLHKYHLDDDSDLASCMIIVHHVGGAREKQQPLVYAGRGVDFVEIPKFYGRSVIPPYPRYIHVDGTPDYNWPSEGSVVHT